VLNAYAKSPFADKATQAKKLLDEMKEHPRIDCRPDTISYNSLLESCSNAFGNAAMKAIAFEIALQAFKVLLTSTGKNRGSQQDAWLSPTSTTFTFFAKTCRRLLASSPDKKKSALSKTLQICQNLGMLNRMVVKQYQTACQSQEEWEETVGELGNLMQWKDDFEKCQNIPKAWTCNSRR
jgi:hypothetical protein